jgi:hypothetical protein
MFVVTRSRAGLGLPADAVQQSVESGFEVTVGEILVKNGIVENSKDPHKSLCGYDRASILAHAVTVGLGRLSVDLASSPQKTQQSSADETTQ